MRAHEFIKPILFERFNNTKWLLDSIYHIVSTLKIDNDYNPKEYYSRILNHIFSRNEIKPLLNGLRIEPQIVVVEGKSDYIVGAKIVSNTFKNFLDYFRWNEKIYYITFQLTVTDIKPINKSILITDLDSIVGHEIEHMIQRIGRVLNDYHTPGKLKHSYFKYILDKNSIVNYENNTNYVNVYKSLDTEVQYYLRHGELLSHAYSIGSYLYYQYGTDSIKILSSLYNKGWNNNLHNVKVSYKVKWFLNKYNQMIRRAEQYNIVNDGKKLWNKLFKEIYRVILNKER